MKRHAIKGDLGLEEEEDYTLDNIVNAEHKNVKPGRVAATGAEFTHSAGGSGISC